MAGEDAQRDNDVTTGAVTKVTDSPVGPTVGAMPVRGRATGGRVTAPGRVASAEETADAIADLAGAEFAEAASDLMQGIYAAYDPDEDDAPTPPQPHHVPEGLGDPAVDPTDGLPERPRTLPALLGAAGSLPVVALGTDVIVAPPEGPRWHQIRHLPAFQQRPIMAFGRSIFRSFPCFQQLDARRRAAGVDAMSEVRLLASIGGRGPSDRAEVDVMSNWIRENGAVLDAGQIGFEQVMPGYRPNVILAATDDETFLLVEERLDRGAPADAAYVYSWAGGVTPYLANDGHRQVLDRMVAQRPAIAAPAAVPMPPVVRTAVPDPVEVAAPAFVAEPRPARRAAPRNAPTVPARHRVQEETAPTAPLPKRVGAVAPMAAFRAAGFAPYGTAEGPALRRESEDGIIALIYGEAGRSLALARSFRVKLLDEDGNEIEERACDSHDEVLEYVSEPRGNAMKP